MTPYFHPFLTGLDGGDIACNAATNNQQIFLFYAVSVIAISSALVGCSSPASVAYDRLDGLAIADGATIVGRLGG
jgi:hypothetical protein